MARAQGINTNLHTVIALMISNGLVGLSGGLYAQYQGAADVNMGRGAIVIGLAAVIIGEVIFGRLCAGKNLAFAYTLFSVIGGAIIYYIVMNVVLWLKLPSDDLKLFLRDRCGSIPCHSLSEIHTQRKGAVTPWQKC